MAAQGGGTRHKDKGTGIKEKPSVFNFVAFPAQKWQKRFNFKL